MTVGVRVALLAVAALAIAGWHWGPGELDASLPMTSLIAQTGGRWRDLALPGGSSRQVVVHRNVKWCTCPGLGVASQLVTGDLDSAFALSLNLFKSLAVEGANGPGRCLTVSLETGTGRHWPWTSRPYFSFSWHLRPDGQWVFFGYTVPAADYQAAHRRSAAWHAAT